MPRRSRSAEADKSRKALVVRLPTTMVRDLKVQSAKTSTPAARLIEKALKSWLSDRPSVPARSAQGSFVQFYAEIDAALLKRVKKQAIDINTTTSEIVRTALRNPVRAGTDG
jgi:hypothetical protein